MKKMFVIIQQEGHPHYEMPSRIIAIRDCSLEDIKKEVNHLNSSVIEGEYGESNFYYIEAPLNGYSSDFKLDFKDPVLAEQSFLNNLPMYMERAKVSFEKRSESEHLSIKDVFMSMGEIMDLYFNTGLTKEKVSEFFDNYTKSLV